MRRVIEKLAHERKQKEDEFSRKLQELKKKTQEILTLQELQNNLGKNLNQIKGLFSSLIELIELQAALSDAKDREWDALGSNHVGMIFKSMEWRVDKLAAEYGDVKLLMRKFIHIKEKLNRLLSTLEEKKMPSSPQVKELLEPLEEWGYAGFENRFRGYEEDVKRQQAGFLPYFKNGLVLDLGCGRGEFLELLQEKGIEATGIDINDEMVEICRDKGLNCLKGDLLEKLAEYEDATLGGIFSSQVVEHLPPPYLSKMVELAYFKLASPAPLILETINPTSVFSLVQIYILDLSHKKPIHPQALKFLMESSGFERIKVKYSSPLEEERLQELPASDNISAILNQNIDKLNRLLYAPANYAVIGIKP